MLDEFIDFVSGDLLAGSQFSRLDLADDKLNVLVIFITDMDNMLEPGIRIVMAGWANRLPHVLNYT